jgi:hypothetical protein
MLIKNNNKDYAHLKEMVNPMAMKLGFVVLDNSRNRVERGL